MGNYDYSTPLRPQMPQFRESDGRLDWRQMLDLFLPGNWWNSRTNQYRPLGIASGVTGLPIEGAVAFGRGAGNFLQSIGRGNSGAGDRSWMGPSMATRPTLPDFVGQNIWGTQNPNQRVVDWQMPGTQSEGGGRSGGGGGGSGRGGGGHGGLFQGTVFGEATRIRAR